MADQSVYWTAGEHAPAPNSWYQPQPAPAQQLAQQPSYLPNSYQAAAPSQPPEQNQNHNQTPSPQQHLQPAANQLQPTEQLTNGMHNGTHTMQSPIQTAPTSQPVAQYNHHIAPPHPQQQTHNPNSIINHQQPNHEAPMQPPLIEHQLAAGPNYRQMHPHTAYPQQQHQQPPPLQPPPPPPPPQQPAQQTNQPNTIYAQPNSYQNNMMAPNSSHSPANMQPPPALPPQQQHQQQPNQMVHQHQPAHHMHQPPQPQQPNHYPHQQYSPAPYWSSPPPPPPASMHGQPNYGPASSPHLAHQGGPTPPAPIPDPNSSYHHGSHNSMQPSNMPYDNRTANYPPPYQAQPGYYNGTHEVQAPVPDPSLSGYEMTNQPPQQAPPLQYQMQHQQHSQPAQNNWSNGYYQPTHHHQQQPPYQGGMNPSYPPMAYNANHNNSGPVPNHQVPIPHQMHPGPPQHGQAPHYPHQNPQIPSQQSLQWPMQQNHTKPIVERNIIADNKKPVKARGPRKQSNPNAPTGRRKRPYLTEEHKQSGYAKFYQIKRKELKVADFSQASKLISDLWNRLSDDEKSIYAQDVSNKRKEMLKKKASQQAQNLLVQGITPEIPDVMIRDIKKD